MYERALQGYKKALGSPTFETYLPALNTFENLGDVYQHTKKPELAKISYSRAHGGLGTVFGDNNEQVRAILKKLETTHL